MIGVELNINGKKQLLDIYEQLNNGAEAGFESSL
jgi:hypothetical protein